MINKGEPQRYWDAIFHVWALIRRVRGQAFFPHPTRAGCFWQYIG